MGSFPSVNFILTILAIVTTNIGFALIYGLFSNIPQPLEQMFNESFRLHYGTYLDSFGISTIWSIATIFQNIGELIGIFLIFPLIDRIGRKFVAIHLRFILVVIAAFLLLVTYFLPSFEAFLVAVVLLSASFKIKFSAVYLYVTECASRHHRGLAIVALTLGEPLSTMITLSLFRPSILGNEANWFLIPIISLLICLIAMLYLVWLPESPRRLIYKGKTWEAKKAFEFFSRNTEKTETFVKSTKNELKSDENVHYAGYLEVLKNDSYRQALILLSVMSIISDISPNAIEYSFFVKLHSLLGFQTETIMTIGTLQRLIFLPLFFFSTYAIEKRGRRWIVLASFALIYLKSFLLASATTISYFTNSSVITMLLGILSDSISGIMNCLALPGTLVLLNCELTDPSSRIKIMQITSSISIIVGSIFLAIVPYAFNVFPPLPYFALLAVQPFLIGYVYRNLPETAGRKIEEIVEDFEEAVRSRAPTRRTTILEETTPLLAK